MFRGLWAEQSTERSCQTRAWSQQEHQGLLGHGGTGQGLLVVAARAASNLLQEILIHGNEAGRESIGIKPLNGRSFLAPVFTFPLPLEVVVGPFPE